MVESFGKHPTICLEGVGYGAGTRRLSDRPNVLRCFLGKKEQKAKNEEEKLLQVEVNLDDFNPEILAHVTKRLFSIGAIDVWVTPIQMKKGRSGHLLSLLCKKDKFGSVEELIFKETSTLGMRYFFVERSIADRVSLSVTTSFGEVILKIGRKDGVVCHVAPEYENCVLLAEQNDVPLKQIYEEALNVYKETEQN